jgi:hypothetical protein
VAETVTPSVRGTLRVRVVVALLAAGVVTGAASAALPGAVWRALDLPRASVAVAALVALVAVGLDAVHVRPLDIRRQVPQLWGRLFAPETVAVLYGARLGVGPLTILTSWLWWAAIAIAVTLGPLPAAVAGASFHVARVATMLAATAGAQSRMPDRIALVQRRERDVARVAIALAAVAALAVASSDFSRESRPPRADSAKSSGGAASGPASAPAASATTTTSRPPVPRTPETDALDALIPDDPLPGFTRVPDGTRGAGPLDLDAAAAAEHDTQAERAVLETRHFRRGIARVWVGPDDPGDTVYIAIYEFADAAGASANLEDGRELLEARKVTRFPVDVPGAFGFSQIDESGAGPVAGHAVAFTSANRYALVIVGGEPGRRTPDEARSVAAAVAARLSPPASSSTPPTPAAPS